MFWLNFGIKDLIDVLLVACFLYYIYKLMKSSGTLAVFGGVIAFLVIWIIVSQVLEMRLMGSIMDKIVSAGIFVLVILFQDEIRRFLLALGSHRGWKSIIKFIRGEDEADQRFDYVKPLVRACVNMARNKTGALIVIQEDEDLSPYEHRGEMFDAEVNDLLIENIFFKNSPLHDGAMIINNRRRISAAACVLPVSYSTDIPQEMGLRHRAGLGMCQKTDAFVIIISEERGSISIAHNGHITADVSSVALQQMIPA